MPSGVLVDVDHLGATFIPKWVSATLSTRSLKTVSWMPGRYTNKSNLLLNQKDTFDCGLFCTLLVFDFVLTQWGKENGFDNLRAIKRIDYEREIFIPKDYGLGDTFQSRRTREEKDWLFVL
jgi:hypothetical protein